jgi:hypothetical protein
MNWYKEVIEEPIRDLVKLLRDNGFNTTCSCGHEMYVECQYIPDGVLERLHQLLFEKYKNYKIEITLECLDGCWRSGMIIYIEKEK